MDRSEKMRHARTERAVDLLIWGHILAALASLGALLYVRQGRQLPSLPELVFSAINVPVFPSFVSVALLMLLISGLVRRKRLALLGVATLQVTGALYSATRFVTVASQGALPGPTGPRGAVILPVIAADLLSPVAAVAMLVLLFRLRGAFPGTVARRSWPQALLVLAGGVAVTVGVTYLMLLATVNDPRGEGRLLLFSLGRAMGLVAGRIGGTPAQVSLVTGLLLGLTVLAAAVIFLRSPKGDRTRTGEQEVALRRLLAEHGRADSLSYFATRRDKELVFSPDGEAVIAYEVSGAVAVAAGDPIGVRSSWPAAMDEFLVLCRRSGWIPSALAAGEDAARAWTERGLIAVPMGDEAILDAEHFQTASTSLTEVRRAAARARADGVQVRLRRHGSLTVEERAEMIRCANAWRHDGDERGFSMALSRLGDPADATCLLVSAHAADGTWVGLLSLVPWGRTGASLDVMRRSPTAPHGVMELMVSTLLTDGPRLGVKQVSLNFAMFRQVFDDAEKLGASVTTRIIAAVLQRADRWFQLERLYRSNQKYRPTWVTRYLLADGLPSLPRTALAAARLEGFAPRLTRPAPEAPALDATQLDDVRRIESAAPVPSDLAPRRSDQSRHRVLHLEQLRAAGMEPYPVGVPAPMDLAEVAKKVQADAAGSVSLEPTEGAAGHLRDDGTGTHPVASSAPLNPSEDPLTHDGQDRGELRVAGRVRHLRDLGGVAFVELMDRSERLQAIMEREQLGAASFDLLTRAVDRGDLLEISGRPGRSRTGEPSLIGASWRIVSKALQPIPFDSFEDPESRLRRRATDLIVHPQTAELLRARSAVVQAVRQTLLDAGAMEVETPVLATVHGGANARPFRTRINAYDTDLTLRIAPELQLKKLLVGGLGPIFEIGRNFRNEGADATHNPEFTALETYWPYSDYTGMRHLTERLVRAAARAVHGDEVLPVGEGGALVDVSGPWEVITVCDAVSRAVGRSVDVNTDIDELLEIIRDHDLEVREDMGPGALIEELYGELVEPATMMPTFYLDFPAETSPLTAPHRSCPGLVERWDLVAGGMEIGTAYSELADPLIQRERLTAQSLKAAAGDAEAMEVDESFLEALENAMPPAGGLGIGMDRLAMLITRTAIRDVLAFPFVRPHPRTAGSPGA
ncbi:bifunctional lysylphosphatidylglycerol synthetase/lysine--tRNA ligase LysX [Brachybacterium timonense]|uniref:bifunctional lysylphosphatidylglycerol synthetase/lysine--tRNA ligase LysX n=1 Tax=Brachybacterium timonense TaxID=2050896 RepID=UPI001482E3B5|nr:bifunctional lysylphosphatidylglycerol synthetase/lysine--tRNA ligase LysX [Brachybacterium timonense]